MTTPPTPSDPASPSGTPDSATDPALAALGAALAGEHAAVYAYGVAGAFLADEARDRAASELALHRRARDQLTAQIRAAGGTPPASLPAYALPFPVEDAASATALADHVESRLVGLYADVVADVMDSDRSAAAAAMVHNAQARAIWAGVGSAFPGLDDRLTL